MSLHHKDLEPVAGQLRYTLDQGDLPSKPAGWGSQLLQRLCRPVRIAVTGLPESGKSAVMDMLLGHVALGRKPTNWQVEVCFGPHPQVVVETAEGEHLRYQGVLADLDLPENTILARQFLPEAHLQWQTYCELPLLGQREEQEATLHRIAQTSDVILWCSQEFLPHEQALWASVPDRSKDHSFLVFTMADRQIMRGTLTGLLQTAETTAAEEFLGVYPVAAIQGLTAQKTLPPAPDLWRSSGGQRLQEDVQHQIELGRASDLDQAQMFVQQYGAVYAEQIDQPQDPICDTRPRQSSVTSGLTHAIAQLQSGAEDMLAQANAKDGPQVGPVLEQCMQLIQNLSNSIEDLPDSDLSTSAQQAVQEGEEMLLLCQLEEDENAAIDAVTLLFQLKKELSTESLR